MTTRTPRRAAVRGLGLALALALPLPACGPSQPEIKPDPALANKPFPSVDASGDANIGKRMKTKAPGFPSVKSAGDAKAR